MLFSGRYFFARLVTEDDAEFVFQLRTSEAARHIKPVEGGVENQRRYIRRAIELFDQRKEAYVVVENANGERQMLSRISGFDQRQTKLGIHSYISIKQADPNLVLNNLLASYQIFFEHLGAETTGVFYVPRQAEKVNALYRKINMVDLIKQDEQFNYYQVAKANYRRRMPFFKKLGFDLSEWDGLRRHLLCSPH